MARQKKKSAESPTMQPFEGLDIPIPADPEGEEDSGVSVNPTTGTVTIDNDDGSVTIDPTGVTLTSDQDYDNDNVGFDDNLAEVLDERGELVEMGRIAEELMTGIEADKKDRSQWEQMRAKCIELVGMKLEEPKSDVSTSALGMSTSVVRDPTLLEAVERFRANAYAELCPSSGPIKVVDWGSETAATDDLATEFQKDLNYYMTNPENGYYDDTRYMLWWTGLTSGTFKKVYKCPVRNRPVSEYVDGTNLIVPSNAINLKTSPRVTHESTMNRGMMKRMQWLEVYRDVSLGDPMPMQPNVVDNKKANIEGKTPQPSRQEDQDFTIYECYCQLNLKGFEHKDEDGEETGLPLPYIVTIEEDTREILEIRRNWDVDDENQEAQIPFILFPYSTGLSRIYGSGLGQMGGNIVSALTALTRITIDGGMMSNYPGLLKAKGTGRQLQNEIRVPPGGCAEIDTGGLPIQQTVMGMPYKDMSANVIAFIQQMREVGQRLLGTAELPVGEGKQDAPVGTTLAMIEQATKIEGSVHKALHAAQSAEFELLTKLFKKDPDALFRGNPRPAMGPDKDARIAKFKQALESWQIVPVSDPNVPSEMHRLAKAQILLQLGAGDLSVNQVALKTRAAAMMGVGDWSAMLNPPSPQQTNPMLLIEQAKLQVAQEKNETDKMKIAAMVATSDADRKSKETIESIKLANTVAVHPESNGVADQQLMQMMPLIHPIPDPSGGLAKMQPGMSEGGSVPDPEPMSLDEAHSMHLAKEIVKFLDGQKTVGAMQ